MAKCSIANCYSPVKYLGLCGKHYKRQWRHGDPHKTMINMEGGICVVPGCGRPRKLSNGLCHVHGLRYYRHGRLHTIVREKGKGTINAAGYRILGHKGKRIYEHRRLAEKALGRALPKGAVVHHMNGNGDDNFAPFNLVVCPNQAYHMLLHKRMKLLGLSEEPSR